MQFPILHPFSLQSQTLGPSSDAIRKAAEKRETRVTKMVLLMITAFTVCWLPYALVCLYKMGGGRMRPLLSVFPLLFAKSSICWNPVIYIFMNHQVIKLCNKTLWLARKVTLL